MLPPKKASKNNLQPVLQPNPQAKNSPKADLD